MAFPKKDGPSVRKRQFDTWSDDGGYIYKFDDYKLCDGKLMRSSGVPRQLWKKFLRLFGKTKENSHDKTI